MSKRKFLIVGGGTTGWLLALFLIRRYPKNRYPDVDVTLVESPDVGTIGVGEGTFQRLNAAFAVLGLDDDEWMPQCDATYKTGINFVNWGLEPQYFHAFQVMFRDQINPYFWKDGDMLSPVTCSFADTERVPTLEDFVDVSNYYCPEKASRLEGISYHFDSGKLADYLKRKSVERGLIHVLDTITSVQTSPDGSIQRVVLRDNGPQEADFFLDCSGFHGVLIDKALGVPFVDEKRSLLCDRALATRIPQTDTDRLKAQDRVYTTSTTGTSGWMWQIPLSGRDGCGYVYSSDFISNEQAVLEFQEFLQNTYAVSVPETDIKQLRFRTGQRQASWHKNCVSFGLASNFIEPLEATAIGMTSISIVEFLRAVIKLDKGGNLSALRDEFNDWETGYYNDVKDFIIAHYVTASRDDTPFWQANKREIFIPQSLQQQLDSWTEQRLLLMPKGIFSTPSWFSLLVGQSYR